MQATFIGRLSAADSQTARFDIAQIRGGSLDGYAVATLVDVQYQQDVRFLTLDESYIVAVGIDQTSGLLYSKFVILNRCTAVVRWSV